jgi:acetoin:2,6-dichlorophenolindophenol oxidoreductase subunit alpha
VTAALDTPPGKLRQLAAEDLDLLLLIRHFELALLDLFDRGLLDGTTHTCLGQEYVPVSLRPLLDERDFVFSNHRGHGHYLARFDDPHGLLAEIMGREGGLCNGVGGSQHLFRGRHLSTGVQGESLPVAAGVALHLKNTEPGRIALAYIGDGTWGEGAVYETLNLASLWRLPLLIAVEHNGIAQSTPTGGQLAGTIAGRAHAFDVRHLLVESAEPATIRDLIGPAVAGMRTDPQPLVVEFRTQRLGPHSKGDDTRDPAEIARLRADDWHERYTAADPDRFAEADARQRQRIDAVVCDVTARPPSTWDGTP